MNISPTFRVRALDIARTIRMRVAANPKMAEATGRLFEHVEHIVHGRKSYDAPHLGAEMAHIEDNNVREASFSLLVSIEAIRQDAASDAEIFLGDAASLLGVTLAA